MNIVYRGSNGVKPSIVTEVGINVHIKIYLLTTQNDIKRLFYN